MTAFPAILATLLALAITLAVVFGNLSLGGPLRGGRLLQVAWLIACGMWFVWWVGVARAEEGHTHEGVLGRFYSTWMMPDAPKVSCCSDQDCSPAASRFVNNRWEAQRNGLWYSVPPNKVEQNRDSPDGRSHLCGRPGYSGEFTVFCFVRGQGA